MIVRFVAACRQVERIERRLCVFFAVSLASALVAPLAASGATVSVDLVTAAGERITRPTLTVSAGEGEANRVTVTVERGERVPHPTDPTEEPVVALTWVVTDEGAPLVAGDGCTSIGEHRASCPAPLSTLGSQRDVAVAIALGDRDDRASAATACFYTEYPEDGFTSCKTSIEGGGGNDTLFADGDNGFVNLYGGGGNDTLYGGTGEDALFGDAGDDTFYGRDKAKDLFAGGAGNDRGWGEAADVVNSVARM